MDSVIVAAVRPAMVSPARRAVPRPTETVVLVRAPIVMVGKVGKAPVPVVEITKRRPSSSSSSRYSCAWVTLANSSSIAAAKSPAGVENKERMGQAVGKEMVVYAIFN